MKKSLFPFLLILSFCSYSQTYQKRLALVVGNAGYQNGGTLKNPINDARAIASTLQNLGFEVLKYENVTQPQMKQAINAFGQKLRGYDVGMFYYAGHGIQSKGVNYMIPIEAQLENEEQVEFDCVAADRVLAFMETASTKVNIIIMDACRNNPFERSWHRSANGNGLAMMNAPSGSLIAYATAPGRVASDGDESNGLYTSALLKYMRNANLTIEQVFKQVRNEVNEKSGGAQIPWETTSLTGEDFYLGAARKVKSDPINAEHINVEKSTITRNSNAVVSDADKAQAVVYTNQALINYEKYEYDKAIETLGKAINLDPNNAQAYYWRGNSYYGLKDYYKAIENLSVAIEIKPDYAEAYYWRGNANFGVKQDNDALDNFSKAIALKANYTDAYFWRGRTYYELLQDDNAMADFSKVLALNPNYSEAYYWKGQLYYAAKKYNETIQELSTAINLKNIYPEAYYWRANAKLSLRLYAEAISDFAKAIEQKPSYPEAYLYRGKCYYYQTQDANAIKDFTKATEINPNYAEAYYWMGVVNYASKKYDIVIQNCTKALEVNPQHADAFYTRGLAHYYLKQDAEAIDDFSKSLELKPAADAYYYRGITKYWGQNYGEAIPDFTKAIQLDATGTLTYTYYYWRGNAYYGLKMDSNAIDDFTKTIELKPDYAEAWYYRGCSHFYSGHLDASLTDINKAIALDPSNTKYTDFKSKNFK